MTFKLCLANVSLNLILPSATMEQEPLFFYCHHCNSSKPREEFSIHKRDSKDGVQGNPPSRCASCAAKEQERHKIRKQNKMKRVLTCLGVQQSLIG